MTNLGREIQIAVVSLRDASPELLSDAYILKVFNRRLLVLMDMQAIDQPAIWSYPVDGKGGVGHTIIQPIVTSFIAQDTWPEHQGAIFVIVSCQPFSADKVIQVAEQTFKCQAQVVNLKAMDFKLEYG